MTEASLTQPTPTSDVFVSYASSDAAVANAIVEALERAGLKCWIAPRDVQAGAQYADAIVRAISNSKAFVLVLSASAIDSAHVGREVERAASKHRRVLALRVDAAPLTPALEYFLSESQWVEAQSGKRDAAYARLIEAIRAPEGTGPTNMSGATPGKTSTARPSSHRPGILLAAGLGVLALVLAGLWAGRSWLVKPAPGGGEAPTPAAATAAPVISDKSIAVLPFVDMSEKHDQEYFSDGLSEELIDHLAHITDLKVIARTSSFAFKGKNEDMRTIATKLGVANLLEGSVRKSGGTLRITAQLIRASDGVHLWSESYDRKLNDIFKVQDEISTTVAKALNVALNATKAVGIQVAAKGTTNIEAYNLLLQGKYFYDRGGRGDAARAVERYQQALRLDPHYALAWAALARSYANQGYAGDLTATEAEVKGREAAERALAIDPNCAEAYYARGIVAFVVTGDWVAAKSDFARTVALDPHGQMGDYAQENILDLNASISGHHGELIASVRHHLERNPLDALTIADLALYLQRAEQLDESAATYRKLLELYPAYETAQAQYALTLLLMGKQAEALAAAEKESDEASRLQVLVCIYWTMGRRAESESALSALEHKYADRNEYMIAEAYAYRGEVDAAFKWLDRTYQQRKGSLEYLKTDPLLRNLRADPRFNALLRKAKLIET